MRVRRDEKVLVQASGTIFGLPFVFILADRPQVLKRLPVERALPSKR